MAQPKIVECVPNFSEGRSSEVIESIASAIRGTEGCSLLDVDAGASTNRTVYTFVGSPNAAVQGALAAARMAFKHIDMTKHKGAHPRIGALDVCPFVPVANVTMEECVRCSQEFSEQLAKELHIPVYLYECAQEREYRKSLGQIREGEYEGLKEKLTKPEWSPDFGPSEFVPRWGATVAGARTFLIAYNVNLLSTKQQAHRIALDLRELGRGPDERGRLKCVKALGWYLEEYDMAQVSMNLTDFETTPLHVAFEECCKDARSLNLAVVGSEIVGLVPLKAVLMAAEYYIQQENLFILHEHQKLRLVVQRLGLNTLAKFNLQEKIIEYKVGSNEDGPLLSGSVRHLVETIASRTATPGGGAVAACSASMGAALGTMVGFLTFGNRKYESLDPVMRQTIAPLHEAIQELLPLADKDSQAFSDYLDALRLPHKTVEEKASRQKAIDSGLKKAIEVPLTIARVAHSCWPHLETLAEHGNIAAITDLQVGAHSLCTGIQGAYYNVCTNLKQVTDGDYVSVVTKEVEELMHESEQKLSAVLQLVGRRSK